MHNISAWGTHCPVLACCYQQPCTLTLHKYLLILVTASLHASPHGDGTGLSEMAAPARLKSGSKQACEGKQPSTKKAVERVPQQISPAACITHRQSDWQDCKNLSILHQHFIQVKLQPNPHEAQRQLTEPDSTTALISFPFLNNHHQAATTLSCQTASCCCKVDHDPARNTATTVTVIIPSQWLGSAIPSGGQKEPIHFETWQPALV